MAIVHVQTQQAGTGADVTQLDLTATFAAGNLVVVHLMTATQPAFTLTDITNGNIYNLAYSQNGFDSLLKLASYYAFSVTGGSTTLRFDVDAGGSYPGMIASEFSGLIALDQMSSLFTTLANTQPHSNPTPFTTTPRELVIGALVTRAAPSTILPGSGYGIPTNGNHHTVVPFSGIEYRLVTIANVYTANWDISPADYFVAGVTTFAEAPPADPNDYVYFRV